MTKELIAINDLLQDAKEQFKELCTEKYEENMGRKHPSEFNSGVTTGKISVLKETIEELGHILGKEESVYTEKWINMAEGGSL